MKTTLKSIQLGLVVASLTVAGAVLAAEPAKEAAPAKAGDLVALDLKLPAPAFKGTPKDIQLSAYVEPLSDKPRPPMMVPAGLKNLAAGAKLTASDKNATASTLEKVTDGDKEASDQSIIFLRKGTQWVELDLGSPQEIFAVVIWHAHNMAKIYRDVVVQAAADPDFIENVREGGEIFLGLGQCYIEFVHRSLPRKPAKTGGHRKPRRQSGRKADAPAWAPPIGALRQSHPDTKRAGPPWSRSGARRTRDEEQCESGGGP